MQKRASPEPQAHLALWGIPLSSSKGPCALQACPKRAGGTRHGAHPQGSSSGSSSPLSSSRRSAGEAERPSSVLARRWPKKHELGRLLKGFSSRSWVFTAGLYLEILENSGSVWANYARMTDPLVATNELYGSNDARSRLESSDGHLGAILRARWPNRG